MATFDVGREKTDRRAKLGSPVGVRTNSVRLVHVATARIVADEDADVIGSG